MIDESPPLPPPDEASRDSSVLASSGYASAPATQPPSPTGSVDSSTSTVSPPGRRTLRSRALKPVVVSNR